MIDTAEHAHDKNSRVLTCTIDRVAATLSSSRGKFQALRHIIDICSSHAAGNDDSGMVRGCLSHTQDMLPPHIDSSSA
ncbi:hypothetical protein DOTSEDRAFT_75031 [Dothistroma septosporum NZE10]|uniref:Uncharacterized protein n=1 Tax=Dothistroma septosporum (strain NZE10 / CBS 128990) TaxID=675120 RepID=M2XI45_DOTSN|nr:hypothetical protein DOTSEDRAFT_75031 [Dothistroma septosporum NZE10]